MERDGYERLKAIVLEAAKRKDAERAGYLDGACQGDADLRREAEALLAHESDPTGALRTAGAVPHHEPPIPDLIGPYRILDRIGEGGMGVVYAAEQTESIHRKVALKVVADPELLTARGTVAAGLEAVARIATRGDPFTLMVEDDYHLRGSIAHEGGACVVSPEVDLRDTIDDAVDAVIDRVLARGGNVIFTPPGTPANVGRIVLLRRVGKELQ